MPNLDELVTHYGELDSKIKSMSKELESDKITIKNTLADLKQKDYSAGGYTVTRTVSYRTKYNEDKMLDILKRDWKERYGNMECPYIKTKEYIDMDQLESVLYAGELPAKTMMELNNCQEKTEIVTLKCGKTKKKED